MGDFDIGKSSLIEFGYTATATLSKVNARR